MKLITGIKKNMLNNKPMLLQEKLLLRKKGVIESVFNVLKNRFNLEHTRHRPISNACIHFLLIASNHQNLLLSCIPTSLHPEFTYVWDPLQIKGFTHCYNPLRDKDVIAEDVQKLTHNLIQALISDLIPVYENARMLLNGLILYVLAHNKKAKTLGEVVKVLMNNFVGTLPSILKLIENKIHPLGLQFLQHFLTKTNKVQSKNMSVLMSLVWNHGQIH